MTTKQKTRSLPIAESASQIDQSKLLGLLGYNCRRAYLVIFALFRERLAELELGPVEYSVLILIRDNPRINQKTLAKALGIDPPNMATLLDRLEKREILARVKNPEDQRVRLLELTSIGKKTCTAAEKIVVQLEVDASPNLTDRERKELIRLAQKIFCS